MKDKHIQWKQIQAGQLRPYADSIYEYEITTNIKGMLYNETDEEYDKIKEFCTEILYPSKNEGGGGFNGSCSFPHGLNSYYKFVKRDRGSYHYIVCQPYTG